MTLPEMNSEFSVLFEDLNTNGTKGLDQYERSVCLTYAQEAICKALIEAKQFDPLADLTLVNSATSVGAGDYPNSNVFPHVHAMKVLDRFVVNASGHAIYVERVDTAYIRNLYNSPYQYPAKNKAVMVYGAARDEVFTPLGFTIQDYKRRIIQYPTPIILSTLSSPDSINGITAATNPILHETYHRAILETAVQHARVTYMGQEEQEVQNPNDPKS